jgi:hypothetical protein
MGKDLDEMRELIDEFSTKILESSSWNPSLTGRKEADSKLYELYLYSIIGFEFTKDNWEISHYCGNKPSNDIFYFRGSPMAIYSNSEKYSYVLIKEKGKKKYELHQSFEIEGISGISHEQDIGIVKYLDARTSVNNKDDIKYNGVPVTFECKYYDKNEISKKMGREILGIKTDLDRLKKGNLKGFVIYTSSQYDEKCRDFERLLNYHNITTHFIEPGEDRSLDFNMLLLMLSEFRMIGYIS